jgi:ABC-type phosphate transport system substrate-binding protein
MHVRKFLTSVASAAVAVAAVALTTAPASAVTSNPQPDDTAGTPVAADLIGVGSDTTMHAVKTVGDAYNATGPANKIFTYAACPAPGDAAACGTITLPSGDITRPNGSGGGKGKLYGAGNNTDIDFARSSSANSTAETDAGLQMFPFALDTLAMAVSGSVPSNAPTSLTPAQIVDIYKGNITNWSAVGGSPGTIAVKMPQTGSGTYSFWVSQLKAMNGGSDVTITGSAVYVQEHDDTEIKDNPNAIAPFSIGRAQLLGGTVRIETGWEAKRAVYNVVRGADVADPEILAAFGSNGYFCSAPAKPLIEASGFKQLFTPSKGGVCGAPTQSATSNFTVAEVPTTTTVAVTSASASSAKIVASVTAATSPNGTVSFYEGATLLQSGVPLVSGQATRVQPATPGSHTYRAVFTPATNTAFGASEGTGTGTVQKATSSISETFDKKVEKGKKAKGTVTVTLAGSTAKASGPITVKEGSKTLVTKTLANGAVTFKLPKLAVGKHTLVISWPGDANGTSSTLTFKIKVKAPPKK